MAIRIGIMWLGESDFANAWSVVIDVGTLAVVAAGWRSWPIERAKVGARLQPIGEMSEYPKKAA